MNRWDKWFVRIATMLLAAILGYIQVQQTLLLQKLHSKIDPENATMSAGAAALPSPKGK